MAQLVERSPVTEEVVGTYEVPSGEQVLDAVRRARGAFAGWSRTAVEDRVSALTGIRKALTDDLDATVAAITRSTGKPDVEALAGDVLTTVELLHYYEKNAASILAPQRRPTFPLAPFAEFHVEHSPLGVVAVIAPWNYPLQLALAPLATALVAGNAVVLKPSELTPGVGGLIQSACNRAGLPPGVVQVLQGGPEVGAALVAARPDRIFFTGSVATGRKVAAAAAEHLVPVTLELGGKDPMIVFDDAHLERAVGGAIYGAFANAGQACVAVERLYVQEPVYEQFVDAVTLAAKGLTVGTGCSADLGPVIRPQQKAVIDAHVDDALQRGARLTTERKRRGGFYQPVVLRDVDHSMKVMREETFGPVLPVMPFVTEEQVIELANDSHYGLSASVWSRDLDKARRVASALVTGSVAVNDVIKNVANPHLPFGGEKLSGVGRYHGPEGLLSFCRQKSVMVADGRPARELNWFPYDGSRYAGLKALVTALHGAQPALEKARRIFEQLVGAVTGDPSCDDR